MLNLTLADGQTLQIPASGTTTYHAQASASATDVTSGATVMVRLASRLANAPGPVGSGGSPSATDLTIVP